MFYLATECLISYLYSKMCNFNFISYCKGAVLFQSHLCNSTVFIRNILCFIAIARHSLLWCFLQYPFVIFCSLDINITFCQIFWFHFQTE